MSDQNFNQEELAALHSLDLLSPEEQVEVEDLLADSPEFVDELAKFEATVASLAYGVPDVPMADDLKTRLFAKIDLETPQAAQKRPLPFPIEELKKLAEKLTSWQPMPGVEAMMAVFEINEETREKSYFIRTEKAVKFPSHGHSIGEELFVLEGDVLAEGQVYRTGDRFYCHSGCTHEPETLGSCLVFGRTSVSDQIFSCN